MRPRRGQVRAELGEPRARDSLGETRAHAVLGERLRARREEIEAAALTRVSALAELPSRGGPEYAEGLRAAVGAAIAYAIAGIEAGDPEPGPIPGELFGQARAAARARVPLEVVLRRYLAGHTLIADFAMRESEGDEPIPPAELQRVLRILAAIVDRLIAAVSECYQREVDERARTPERRRADLVRSLLAGEPVDASPLAYELSGWHLALLAHGHDTKRALRDLARALDCRLLLVPQESGVLWAWLGSSLPVPADRALAVAAATLPAESRVAVGEPAEKLMGWTLTHRQALAAFPVAERGLESMVRYADVALLASALQDRLLSSSLRRLYLEPLERERDGGRALRETLRAYFAAGGNVSSAGAALGVSRPTVTSRLATAEELLGRRPDSCAAELETALRLHALRPQAPPSAAK